MNSYNINVRIFSPPPAKPIKTPFTVKTIGSAAVTVCLAVSEALPFVKDVKCNGILHGVIKAFDKN